MPSSLSRGIGAAQSGKDRPEAFSSSPSALVKEGLAAAASAWGGRAEGHVLLNCPDVEQLDRGIRRREWHHGSMAGMPADALQVVQSCSSRQHAHSCMHTQCGTASQPPDFLTRQCDQRAAAALAGTHSGDRKSTRLNSSHT